MPLNLEPQNGSNPRNHKELIDHVIGAVGPPPSRRNKVSEGEELKPATTFTTCLSSQEADQDRK